MRRLACFAFLSAFLPLVPAARAIELQIERDASMPLVYVNVLVKAGAVDDPKGKLGLTHLMAELMIRGTRTQSKEDFERELDRLGAKLEANVKNDSILIRGACLKSSWPRFLELFEQSLLQPLFSENELRKLKDETLSVLLAEQGNDRAFAYKRFERLFYGKHPFGNPGKGTASGLKSVHRSDILQQYDRLIREGSMVVVGGGDVDSDMLSPLLAKIHDERPGEARAARLEPPKTQGRRFFLLDKADRTQTQIIIGQTGMAPLDPRATAFAIASHVFGGNSFSARLMAEIRVKRGWSYGAYARMNLSPRPRTWMFQSFPATKDSPETLKLSLKLYSDFHDRGITREEYQFAKDALINGEGFNYNTLQKRMGNALNEHLLGLPKGYVQKAAERLEATPYETVNAAVKSFTTPENATILVLATAKDSLEALAEAAGFPKNQVKVVPAESEE